MINPAYTLISRCRPYRQKRLLSVSRSRFIVQCKLIKYWGEKQLRQDKGRTICIKGKKRNLTFLCGKDERFLNGT